MKIQIVKTSESKRTNAIFIVYGDSKAGKTTLIKTWKGKPLLINVEGGEQALRDSDIDSVRVTTADELEEVQRMAVEGEFDHDLFYVDNLTESQAMFLQRSCRGQKPQWADWDALLADTEKFMSKWFSSGLNVVLTSHSKTTKSQDEYGDEFNVIGPHMLCKKLSDENLLYRKSDIIVYAHSEYDDAGDLKFKLLTRGTRHINAGTRVDQAKVPDKIEWKPDGRALSYLYELVTA